MNEILLFSIVMVIAVFVSSCSQIILKRAASKIYRSKIAEYLNFRVIFAYGLFGMAALVNMYVLRHLPISLAPILESTGYIFVAVLGFWFLREKLKKRQLIGMALILVGIIIFSIRW